MSFYGVITGKIIAVTATILVAMGFFPFNGQVPISNQPFNASTSTVRVTPTPVAEPESVAEQEEDPPAVKGPPGTPSPNSQFLAATTTGSMVETYLTDKWGDKITPKYCGTFTSWSSDSQEAKILAPSQCGYDLPEHYYYLTVKGIGTTLEGSPFIPSTILIPVTAANILGTTTNVFQETYTGSTTDAGITFGFPPNDIAHQNVNAGFEVYLNQKHIAEIGGETAFAVGFSPADSYFAIRTGFNEGCAGSCEDFLLSMIQVGDGSVFSVPWPTSTTSVRADIPEGFVSTIPESAGYHWINDNILEFTFYTAIFYEGEYYRVSPEQVWDYNLISRTYTLVRTLPE